MNKGGGVEFPRLIGLVCLVLLILGGIIRFAEMFGLIPRVRRVKINKEA